MRTCAFAQGRPHTYLSPRAAPPQGSRAMDVPAAGAVGAAPGPAGCLSTQPEGTAPVSQPIPHTANPATDLVLERVIDVPVERVWAAWTVPDQLKRWFTPAPWSTVDAELDVRPGGMFRTVMRSPEGQDFPS